MSAVPTFGNAKLDSQFAAIFDTAERQFTDGYIEEFIHQFAKAADPFMWLEDQGIGENYRKQAIGVELLQECCKAWVRAPMSVYCVTSIYFWRTMRELASEAFDAE